MPKHTQEAPPLPAGGRSALCAAHQGRDEEPAGQDGARRASELCRVVIAWDVSRTSLNARLHWRARAARNELAKAAARAGYLAAGEPRAEGPVAVTLLVRRARRLDLDNCVSGAKACLDALFKNAITPDDGPEWLTALTVQQAPHKSLRGREHLIVIVTTTGEESKNDPG